MLALDARAAGYRVVVRTDESPGGPAAQVSDGEFVGAYNDAVVNEAFVAACDVITSEFENLPVSLLDSLAASRSVRPGSFSLSVCQHRRREKEFLASHNIPHAPFAVVRSGPETAQALVGLGGRGILKTAAFGYDGKGQVVLDARAGLSAEDAARQAEAAFGGLGVDEAVLEQFVPFVKEISVVGARSLDGAWVAFAPGENLHSGGILDYTVAPARVSSAVAASAVALAGRIAEALEHVGTIGVEMFVMDDGSLVVNEMAPRPHNSGHHTIDACVTSQFGQQRRAVVGAPLGDPTQHTSAVMLNLLGDLWAAGEPRWSVLEGVDSARLHLYGKASARPGRKMGHLTVLAESGEGDEALLKRALSLRAALLG